MLREYQMRYSFEVCMSVLQPFKQIKAEESRIMFSSKERVQPRDPAQYSEI